MRKVFFPLIAIFLGYQTYGLIQINVKSGGDNSFIINFIIAYLISLFVTGCFAFPGFAYPTSKLLPAAFYKIRNPELIRRLYRALGVAYFRKGLLFFFWGKRKQRKQFFDGKRSGIDKMIHETQQAEFGHFMAFVSITLICLWLTYHRLYELSILTFIINFIGNFYPVVLQRHHRMRIERLI